ncbi:MAG TPA: TIGR01777 family oxidoreductase [Fluviicoccus sp.]|nr:TIGR01777 family oxidoreductase [Fluviicoccus sp.]
MRILLTGGTGFLGSHLTPLLLKEGHHVTIVTRQPMKVFTRYDGMVRALRRLADLTVNDHFDAVINLSGEGIADKPWTHPRKLALYTSRVNFTEELVDWMRRAVKPPKVLLSGSAIGWYGDQGDALLDEDSAFHDEFTHHLTRDWEKAAMEARKIGVRVCLLRTGVVLGRAGGMLRRLLPIFGLSLGGRMGDGRQWMSWISLQDWLAAVLFLLADDRHEGVFNLTSPQPVTNADFTEQLAEALGRKAFLHVPGSVLRMLMGEMSVLMLGGQRVLPSRLLNAGFRFRAQSLLKALELELGVSGN